MAQSIYKIEVVADELGLEDYQSVKHWIDFNPEEAQEHFNLGKITSVQRLPGGTEMLIIHRNENPGMV